MLEIGLERLDAGVEVFCLHPAGVDLRGELGNAIRLERQVLLQGGDLGPEIVEESFVSNGLGGQLVLADAGAVELALEGLDPLVTGAEFGDLGFVACRAHRGLHGGELGAERRGFLGRLIEACLKILVGDDVLLPALVSAVLRSHEMSLP